MLVPPFAEQIIFFKWQDLILLSRFPFLIIILTTEWNSYKNGMKRFRIVIWLFSKWGRSVSRLIMRFTLSNFFCIRILCFFRQKVSLYKKLDIMSTLNIKLLSLANWVWTIQENHVAGFSFFFFVDLLVPKNKEINLLNESWFKISSTALKKQKKNS